MSGIPTATARIERWSTRNGGHAERKVSIGREAARLAATYKRLRLPVPLLVEDQLRLTLPKPEPEVAFIPYHAKRKRGSTGRRDATRATAIRGSRIGRPPTAKTFIGKPCRRGHSSGLRYTAPPRMCVECQKARNVEKARRKAKGRQAA
jgi:hypothetical protein